MNLANTFTLIRLVLIIPLSIFLIKDKYLISIAILSTAGICDLLDGYIARRFNQKTKLGAYLDPLTDKIFAFVTYTILVIQSALPLWFFLFVTIKDISMFLGYIFLKINKLEIVPNPNIYGKFAAFLQVIIMLQGIIHKGFYSIQWILFSTILICTFSSIVAWFLYLRNFFIVVESREKKA